MTRAGCARSSSHRMGARALFSRCCSCFFASTSSSSSSSSLSSAARRRRVRAESTPSSSSSLSSLSGAWGARVVEVREAAQAASAVSHTPRGSPVLSFVHGRLVLPPSPSQSSSVESDGRIILVGDVHGCEDELRALLSLACCSAGDVVLLVGDLVNKGPSSVGVVALARERGMLAVRGNHDDAAIRYGRLCAEGRLNEVPEEWQWTAGLSEEDITYMSKLPFTVDIPEHNVLAVHAGLVPGVVTESQKMEDMYLMRNVVRRRRRGSDGGDIDDESNDVETATDTDTGGCCNGWVAGIANAATAADDDDAEIEWTGTSKASKGDAWASRWRGPRHIVFGHDAMRMLQKYPFATGTAAAIHMRVCVHAHTTCVHQIQTSPSIIHYLCAHTHMCVCVFVGGRDTRRV